MGVWCWVGGGGAASRTSSRVVSCLHHRLVSLKCARRLETQGQGARPPRITTWLYNEQSEGRERQAQKRTGKGRDLRVLPHGSEAPHHAARRATGPELTTARRRKGPCPKQLGTKAGRRHLTLTEHARGRLAGLCPLPLSVYGELLMSWSRDHLPRAVRPDGLRGTNDVIRSAGQDLRLHGHRAGATPKVPQGPPLLGMRAGVRLLRVHSAYAQVWHRSWASDGHDKVGSCAVRKVPELHYLRGTSDPGCLADLHRAYGSPAAVACYRAELRLAR